MLYSYGGSPKLEDAVLRFRNWFHEQAGRSLVIFESADNIDDSNNPSYVDLNSLLPDAPNVDVIVTTRSSRAVDMTTLEAVHVANMDLWEAAELFRRCAKLNHTTVEVENEICLIVEKLGFFPLAIALAGSYVSMAPHLSNDVTKYLPEYRKRRRQLLNLKPSKLVHRYGASVLSTWETSFAVIAHQSPVASKLLSLLGFLNSEDIFFDLFNATETFVVDLAPGMKPSPSDPLSTPLVDLSLEQKSPVTPKNESSSMYDTMRATCGRRWRSFLFPDGSVDRYTIEQAFAVLQTYSFIQWGHDQQGYVMHKLVHTWARDRLDMEQQRELTLMVLGLLTETLPPVDPDLDRLLSNSTKRRPHHMYHPEDLERQRASAMRTVPHVMANFAFVSEMYAPSEVFDVKDLENISSIADVLCEQGRYSDELRLRTFHFRKMTVMAGDRHTSTLTSIENMALALFDQGQIDEAEQKFRLILAYHEAVLSKDDPGTLRSMRNVAGILRAKKKHEQAEEILRRILPVMEIKLGIEDTLAMRSRSLLAYVLTKLGKLEQAERLCRQDLAINESVRGKNHDWTLTNLRYFAIVLRKQKKEKEAEKAVRQIVRITEQTHGKGHPTTLSSMESLAITVREQERYEEAEEIVRVVWSLRTETLGQSHPHTLRSMYQLSHILGKQKKYDQQEELLWKCLSSHQKVLGQEYTGALDVMTSLWVSLRNQAKYAEAEQIGREFLSLRRRF